MNRPRKGSRNWCACRNSPSGSPPLSTFDELVPRIVDEVAASLGCVEINLYLRDLHNRNSYSPAFAAAPCTARAIASRQASEWSDTSPPLARCTTPRRQSRSLLRRLRARYALRSRDPAATRRRSGRSFYRLALRARRFLSRSTPPAARIVRARRGRSAQRPALWR